jgi:uncharacterized protein
MIKKLTILALLFISSTCIFAQQRSETSNTQITINKTEIMKNKMTHFAIHIDDIDRAKKFYESVFDWGFNDYGQQDFAQIKADKTVDGELIGALQSRKYSPLPEKVIGFECTIGVESVDDIITRVKSSGGKILVPKIAIPYVGWIAKFSDTEGNLLCAIQYDNSAR